MKTEEWQDKAAFIDKLRELTDRLNRCAQRMKPIRRW